MRNIEFVKIPRSNYRNKEFVKFVEVTNETDEIPRISKSFFTRIFYDTKK